MPVISDMPAQKFVLPLKIGFFSFLVIPTRVKIFLHLHASGRQRDFFLLSLNMLAVKFADAFLLQRTTFDLCVEMNNGRRESHFSGEQICAAKESIRQRILLHHKVGETTNWKGPISLTSSYCGKNGRKYSFSL